jgi:ribosomal protein S18 acetylase RimI-like enzyme
MKPRDQIHIENWQAVPAGQLAPAYEAECLRWETAMGWDFAPSCRIVEEGRQDGRVPGFVARDMDDRLAGWCFYVLHDGLLQIGGLAGDRPEVLGGLIRAMLATPHAAAARGATCFLFPASADLGRTLERHQFVVEPHAFLARDWPIGTDGAASDIGRSIDGLRWRALDGVDVETIAALMALSFAGQEDARCYAPDGRLDQWIHYVGQLLRTPACGRYLPAASFALEDPDGGAVGAVLVTAIGSRSAHIAQIVVHPQYRGRGLARRLIEAGAGAAARIGLPGISLLVAHSNDGARRLYDHLGFVERAVFLNGRRSAIPDRGR